jgi:hypothetical protein
LMLRGFKPAGIETMLEGVGVAGLPARPAGYGGERFGHD